MKLSIYIYVRIISIIGLYSNAKHKTQNLRQPNLLFILSMHILSYNNNNIEHMNIIQIYYF
jgi:hypothetical protein